MATIYNAYINIYTGLNLNKINDNEKIYIYLYINKKNDDFRKKNKH